MIIGNRMETAMKIHVFWYIDSCLVTWDDHRWPGGNVDEDSCFLIHWFMSRDMGWSSATGWKRRWKFMFFDTLIHVSWHGMTIGNRVEMSMEIHAFLIHWVMSRDMGSPSPTGWKRRWKFMFLKIEYPTFLWNISLENRISCSERLPPPPLSRTKIGTPAAYDKKSDKKSDTHTSTYKKSDTHKSPILVWLLYHKSRVFRLVWYFIIRMDLCDGFSICMIG
jgi:hypothetical protein